MSRFEIRFDVRQRGLGPPAWRRTLGLIVLILSAAAAGVLTARFTP
jgi:hypothetical protein